MVHYMKSLSISLIMVSFLSFLYVKFRNWQQFCPTIYDIWMFYNCRLLVGSPKLSRLGDRHNKTGGLYKCSFNSWCPESCAIQLQAESGEIQIVLIFSLHLILKVQYLVTKVLGYFLMARKRQDWKWQKAMFFLKCI